MGPAHQPNASLLYPLLSYVLCTQVHLLSSELFMSPPSSPPTPHYLMSDRLMQLHAKLHEIDEVAAVMVDGGGR